MLNENFFEVNENGVLTSYLGDEKDIVIPSKVAGIEIKEIGEFVFDKKALRSLVLPEGIK
jgi:superfamily I DNA and/or RNA helicase